MPTAPAPPPLRILVIDDHPDTVQSVVALGALLGHAIRGMTDIPAALDWLERNAVDVVMIDLAMPGRSGMSVADAVARLPMQRDAVLVAVSGHADHETRESALAAGFHLFRAKPFDLADLLAAAHALRT